MRSLCLGIPKVLAGNYRAFAPSAVVSMDATRKQTAGQSFGRIVFGIGRVFQIRTNSFQRIRLADGHFSVNAKKDDLSKPRFHLLSRLACIACRFMQKRWTCFPMFCPLWRFFRINTWWGALTFSLVIRINDLQPVTFHVSIPPNSNSSSPKVFRGVGIRSKGKDNLPIQWYDIRYVADARASWGFSWGPLQWNGDATPSFWCFFLHWHPPLHVSAHERMSYMSPPNTQTSLAF